MSSFFEHLLAKSWNSLQADRKPKAVRGGLDIGYFVRGGAPTEHRISIAQGKRAEHLAVLGKTGSGKSMFLRHLAMQDIKARRGLCFFDLHGDATPDLLRCIAAEERDGSDLSARTIVVEPADRDYSIGLNVLESGNRPSFVQISEFAQILKQRWHLDSFGARTEELLRNSLSVLADSGYTLLELAPLLTNQPFRTVCLQRCQNSEVKAYFESRFNRASEAMQAVFRDAILNKISAFTADPHFRHILGQQRSTFSLLDAIDSGHWIILNLDKGRLGEHVATLGSLLLTKLKNALFNRRSRKLFTLYCDEIQNLVAIDSGLDTLLSEARKFGVSLTSANQFLDQYPASMRSAILAVGTHVFFQLSSQDADKIASALDGGKSLGQLLKNLPKRNLVLKSGHLPAEQVLVPTIEIPTVDYRSLYNRSRSRWARRRTDIEAEIQRRVQGTNRRTEEVLDAWE